MDSRRRAAECRHNRSYERRCGARILWRPGCWCSHAVGNDSLYLVGWRLRTWRTVSGRSVLWRNHRNGWPLRRLPRSSQHRRNHFPWMAHLSHHTPHEPHRCRLVIVAYLYADAFLPGSALARHRQYSAFCSLRERVVNLIQQHLGCDGVARGMELDNSHRLRRAGHRPRRGRARAHRLAGPSRNGLSHRWRGWPGGKHLLHAVLCLRHHLLYVAHRTKTQRRRTGSQQTCGRADLTMRPSASPRRIAPSPSRDDRSRSS